MKFFLLGAALAISDATQLTPTISSHFSLGSRHSFLSKPGKQHFGDSECPCIGFDNIDGETTVFLEDDEQVAYPADMGARCEKWDDGRHPSCKEGESPGFGNEWCGQDWCLVDACNCNIPVLPKLSAYLPDARYRGKPVFYSYATCGGKDMWAKELPQVGTAGCRCIGFEDVPGTTDVVVEMRNGRQKVVGYPAEIGGSCRAWDAKIHPECLSGQDRPRWCSQRWCYVDPCACNMAEVPKVTTYLPEATFTGKSLYYSYETCESVDHFTKDFNLEACVNQKTKDECGSMMLKNGAQKCAWTGDRCLGAELVSHPLCTKALDDLKGHAASGISGVAGLFAVSFGAAVVSRWIFQ